MTAPTPVDQTAREQVVVRLSETVFVEAAAGTGKTTALAERVVRLIAGGSARIGEIAAITFTEKAAGELRDRIRRVLSEHARQTTDDDAAARCLAALAEIDDAAICTLHAFAQRVLASHPLELGMPPKVEVLDDLEARAEFDAAWDEFAGGWLETADDDLRAALLLGLRTFDLRELAGILHDHWDRIEGLPFPGLPDPPVDRDAVLAPLAAAVARRPDCTEDTDALFRHLADLDELPGHLGDIDDDLDFLKALADGPKLTFSKGKAEHWRGKGTTKEIRGLLKQAQEASDRLLGERRTALMSRLAERVRGFVLEYADDRRRRGRLEFHDLLVLARRLLRSHPDARAALRRRWQRLLIDEFQDTDPLQIEIAVLLATPDGDVADAPWWELPVDEGRLFLVGDPKQSIYRFRRADITLYRRARERFSSARLDLVTNFRSASTIIDWVNHIFDVLMDADDPDLQAPHTPLAPNRGHDTAGVTVLGGPTDEKIGPIREREAADVADTIARVRDEGWVVHDDGPRPAQFADVAVLLPTRRLLAHLEAAFSERDIPYRIESRSLLWATQEVRDLLTVLRAVEDPADQVALVAALRSPAFGCRDDDLLEFRDRGGRWNHGAGPPDGLDPDHPVVGAMRALHELHTARHWVPLHTLVERVIRERRLFEVQTVRERPRDHWRRLRFVLDQARAFEESGGATLRAFVDWADEQAEAGVPVNESVLPERDDDAVRVMTVHAAKGLEFPVVVLAGLNTGPQSRRPAALFGDGTVEVDLGREGSRFTSPGYEPLLTRERAAEDCESVRLLYVAATRAKDHLVVSLHHPDRKAKRPPAARLISECAGHEEFLTPPATTAASDPLETPRPVDVPDRETWLAERDALFAGRTATPVVAATAVTGDAGELDDDADRSDDAAPWLRGRAGTSIGRAVHAVLQTVELATGEHLDALARAQAAAEGIPGRVDEVGRYVRAALESDAVQAAVHSARYWREVYVGGAVGDGALEGYVDLLYEDGNDLVVVDYKTDRVVGDPGELVRQRYRLQGGAYAAALESALGRRVSRCTFVFVGTGHPIEVDVDDLPAAVAEVTHRVNETVASPPSS